MTDNIPDTAETSQKPTEASGTTDTPANSKIRFSSSIAVLSDPKGIAAESFGALRTHLLAKHVRDGRRALAICGPSAGVGSTYVAVNLAAAFAQAGISTLLVDGNMRDPGLERYIQPQTEPQGLSQCLAEPEIQLADVVQDEALPNLSLLYAGGVTENAQGLLANRTLTALFDACMRDYEFTIVDTPPSNSSADCRRIAMAVRYAMIVARRNDSYMSDIKTLADELQTDRATVIGSFLNDY